MGNMTRVALGCVAIAVAAFVVYAVPPKPYQWTLPPHFPEPSVQESNPMSSAKIELGRHLFYDTRLSVNGSTSCATCHRQELAFTDGLAVSEGATGEVTPRNSMSLVNVAYNTRQTWANPLMVHLEDQIPVPLFGEVPVEMGLAGLEEHLITELAGDDTYPGLFRAAFPRERSPVSVANIVNAIAAFERSIISGRSAYDHYLEGDAKALTASERRGMDLFFSERLECFHCHGGFNFTDSSTHGSDALVSAVFHNTGLYNLDGRGRFPDNNRGLYEFTGDRRDDGFFKAPTLRNIAVTARYMHDGSIATLDEVIDHYAAGGRARSRNNSEFVPGFVLTEVERADLVAFLESLTDHEALTDPRWADPFAETAEVK